MIAINPIGDGHVHLKKAESEQNINVFFCFFYFVFPVEKYFILRQVGKGSHKKTFFYGQADRKGGPDHKHL